MPLDEVYGWGGGVSRGRGSYPRITSPGGELSRGEVMLLHRFMVPFRSLRLFSPRAFPCGVSCLVAL